MICGGAFLKSGSSRARFDLDSECEVAKGKRVFFNDANDARSDMLRILEWKRVTSLSASYLWFRVNAHLKFRYGDKTLKG